MDTTVVGSASSAEGDEAGAAPPATNDRHFEAGAPDLMRIVGQLHLSRRQQAGVNEAIERADAGAAALIKRERDVREMIAATTPQDPLYAKLIIEQGDEDARWSENRETLRRNVADLLTPAQRTRFEELEGAAGR